MSLARLLERARESSGRLLLAGGDESALHTAADRLTGAGVRGVGLVGGGGIRPEEHPRLESVATLLRRREPDRVRDAIHALDLAADPLRFALGLAALGDASAVVAGPGVEPAALADQARWILGPPADGGTVRSATWTLRENGELVAFADCVFPDELDPPERARLARAVAAIHRRLLGATPHVAFLPSRPGRDNAALLDDAVIALRAMAPDVGAEAAHEVRFRTRPNVLIFPGGTAGLLALRITRALADALALGPFVLGPPGVVAGVAGDADSDELTATAAAALLAAAEPAT